MPSTLHEALIELFRHRPSLAPELLTRALGVELPPHDGTRIEPGDYADLAPTQYRADAVAVLTESGAPVLAVIVEVQLGRDKEKRWSWPVYVTTLRARLHCPTVLLVVCPDLAKTVWCGTPIELGHPGFTLAPLVLGPDRVPVVTDATQAVNTPELAVLSAMAHGDDPRFPEIANALLTVLESVDGDRTTLYSDIVAEALSAAARQTLEDLMATRVREYQSELVRKFVMQGRKEGRELGLEEGLEQGRTEGRTEGRIEGLTEGRIEGRIEGRAEGRAEGEARSLLTVLDARGIEVSSDARALIMACTDVAQLERWIRRATTAMSVDELFA